LRNETLSDRELNFSVQRIIDRIIFLRMCEGRGIEKYGRLRALMNGTSTYGRLVEMFHRADERYNSGLFHFHKEKNREPPDTLTTALVVDDKVLKDIVRRLYFPDSPYEFAALPADILGQVYEQFLGKVIRLTKGHRAKIEEKPEVRKAGGVYYTPTYIVDYIVENTVGKLLEGKTPQEVGGLTKTYQVSKRGRPLTVLDPACGSGSFLIVAYQYLLDWYLKQYTDVDKPTKHDKGKDPRVCQSGKGEWRLTTAERKRILLSHIYGVDIDYQAVEVTKLSLLLKVLEGETEDSLQRQAVAFHKERALPDLSDNIKCGNSLIGPDFYQGQQLDMFDDAERFRINVFDWKEEFSEVFSGVRPRFDVVIGNPPYVRVANIDEVIRPYLYKKYEINHRFDIYVVFVQKGHDLLSDKGLLGYILPNKFISSDYGQSLRAYLADSRAVASIIDFGDKQVFQGVTTYTCLLFLSKVVNEYINYVETNPTMIQSGQRDYARAIEVHHSQLNAEAWMFLNASERTIVSKIRQFPPLGELCDVQHGLQTGLDDVFLLEGHRHQEGDLVQVSSRAEVTPFTLERTVVRRVTKGLADVKRYRLENCDRIVLFPYKTRNDKGVLLSEEDLQGNYPHAWSYLRRHREKLSARKGPPSWYAYRRRNYDLLDGLPRILTPSIAKSASFTLDDSGLIHFVGSGGGGGGGYGINLFKSTEVAMEYILGVLNSSLLDWLLKKTSSRFHSGYYSYNKQYIEPLPIRTIQSSRTEETSVHDQIVDLVSHVLDLQRRLAQTKTDHERANPGTSDRCNGSRNRQLGLRTLQPDRQRNRNR
jgi:hypothetical protein